ncbi:HPP family protein [Comamonas composti]|uniref:HPP family protein n=1 Tax=Comamonas composti TaxID=408558 RepID=UPI0004029B11|nr:HPP family protein [Comamonas composti]
MTAVPPPSPSDPDATALSSSPSRALYWLRNFLPPPVGTDWREGLRMSFGIGLGLLITALISRWWGGAHAHADWMMASMGASAVLVFGMPASPLAQPWPVLAGSLTCLLTGTLCEALIPDTALALAAATGLSVAIMVALRCFHPPGVGLASFVVLEHAPGMELVLFPALFNIVVLLASAVAYNLLTGRAYPHPQRSHGRLPQSGQFIDADLDAALTHYNQVLDISRADLEGLLHMAGRAAFQRTLGDLHCAAVMSKPVFAVEPKVTLKDAWALMRSEQVKALPVIGPEHQVIGIVTHADFVRNAKLDTHEGLGQRLKNLVTGKGKTAQSVADIMSETVQTAHTGQPVIELVPLFSSGGHHHLPVLDAQNKLVGIITQTDLIRVLAATVAPSSTRSES